MSADRQRRVDAYIARRGDADPREIIPADQLRPAPVSGTIGALADLLRGPTRERKFQPTPADVPAGQAPFPLSANAPFGFVDIPDAPMHAHATAAEALTVQANFKAAKAARAAELEAEAAALRADEDEEPKTDARQARVDAFIARRSNAPASVVPPKEDEEAAALPEKTDEEAQAKQDARTRRFDSYMARRRASISPTHGGL